MPGNELVVLESQLMPLAPRFADVLGPTMPPERLIRTVMVSVERTPKLLTCNRQSLFNSAMSAACLGLEVDGVTGQAFLIPFADKAQLVIGYKGYNTLGARSGQTITGATVREGDDFDFALGSGAFVNHKPKLGNKGRIIGAWSCAAAHGRPPVVAVLSIDEIMDIKGKSPGARKSDSPWNDPTIGFVAMAEKSVKRRLARSMPLNIMQLAARMDEAFEEQGRASHISPEKGLIIDGDFSPLPAREPGATPSAAELISSTSEESAAPSTLNANGSTTEGAADYIRQWDNYLDTANGEAQLRQRLGEWNSDRQKEKRRQLFASNDPNLSALIGRVKTKANMLTKKEPA